MQDASSSVPPGHLCPSCERFIGAADECPYCYCESARNPVLRVLRMLALFLGIVGLGLLLLMSARRELPVVCAGDVTPMMNFAYVRMCGRVERDSFVRKEDGEVEYISFSLRDETGRIRVRAYDAAAKAIAGQGLIPEKGWGVDVIGVLDVSASGGMKLIVRDAGHFHVDIAAGLMDVAGIDG
jgi:hypothetical protein